MVSLRGSKFGSRVAMLCCNPSHATRPGPGVGIQVNRFNNYTEDRFQVAGHHTGRFQRGNQWNSSYAPFRWVNPPVAEQNYFRSITKSFICQMLCLLRCYELLTGRLRDQIDLYLKLTRSCRAETLGQVRPSNLVPRRQKKKKKKKKNDEYGSHHAIHPCFPEFIPQVRP